MNQVRSWNDPPNSLILELSDIHVWRVRLDLSEQAARECERLLSADERLRAERFHFEKDRTKFRAAHAALRQILARYCNADALSLQFKIDPGGKPALLRPASNLRFNLSHSGHWAVVGICRGREIGIDVEFKKEMKEADRIAGRFFSANEREALRALAPEQKHDAFFRCWSRKEAFIKCKGDGLSFPLDRFDVSLRPDEDPRVIEIRNNRGDASAFSMRDIVVESAYAGAVVAEGTIGRIVLYDYRW